ncbi:MAG TPA: GlsB/YeaQ/YmgE family stress response membrane protein [Deinococcales bacterium]|nr:GlsB/YeaQ/YmgE family stress response membrane protein [Deinococcales bacterium]
MISFIWAILIGALVGWVASLIMKTDQQQGALMNIVIGIVGGLVGRVVFGIVGLSPSNFIGSIVVGIVGAVLLIWALRQFKVLR